MKKIFVGNTPLQPDTTEVKGDLMEFDGEQYYKISNYDNMKPFFMTITSDADHWMFLSSNGGLTCGRKDRESSLFPYYTDDKIHDAKDTTGPLSIFIISKDEKDYLWEPFSDKYKGTYKIKRNLYKNVLGNKVIFEEVNESLELSFGYAWKNSDKYGFVKESWLSNQSEKTMNASMVDGFRNILPYGVTTGLQSNMSTLVDGYKKCELIKNNGLGIYSLSSILTDRAEPSEALKATVVWNHGLTVKNILLSELQLDTFRNGGKLKTESSLKGRRGAYFVHSEFDLSAGAKSMWHIVADVNYNHAQVIELNAALDANNIQRSTLLQDIENGTNNLSKLIQNADGYQNTADKLSTYRHLSNTMFNIMRGGIYYNNYSIPKADFMEYVESINSTCYAKHKDKLNKIDENITYPELITLIGAENDQDLLRIAMEYLPLTFSRRHGDPSRPWNFFQIDVKKEDGSKKLNFQGNWRDIFQNWEALSYSYPHFIEGIIAKFVNASTIDGYNPYRVTKNGIDWEILDPEDPWSNIGYWGDHQIIYLQKLLEVSDKFHAGKLSALLSEKLFVYANVPYRIKDYKEILKNPYDTIIYDDELEALIAERHKAFGADGKLIFNNDNSPVKVNLMEKLLVPLFAKLSNFVPQGGIWLNTQRPEWNDANNALVGYGLSMVTVYYMRRYINFVKELILKSDNEAYDLSAEVKSFFTALSTIFNNQKALIDVCSNTDRKNIVDALGEAGTSYRKNVYHNNFNNHFESISTAEIVSFLDTTLAYIDSTIASNKKDNGLYHSYNLIDFNENGYAVRHLNDMLEGQVALLSAGYLNSEETVALIAALYKSEMYREDQNSFMLYPDKTLPAFLEKNNISPEQVNTSEFIRKQLADNNKNIVEKDQLGGVHFNGSIKNANQLNEILAANEDISAEETQALCALYVDVFNHHEFTGRSGTFFKYEGLGSIYWHMVSKLLLAVQENFFEAISNGDASEVIEQLRTYYYNIRKGIGVTKNPADYGAFPIDPYSHTPGFSGVQQPGMTGQVKEDFIGRFGELGLIIKNGKITIQTDLLQAGEFIDQQHLNYSYCMVPFNYQVADKSEITVQYKDGKEKRFGKLELDAETSHAIFSRDGSIESVMVTIDKNTIL